MKEGIVKDTFELVLKELQTVLSVSYITIVGIGMLFYYHKNMPNLGSIFLTMQTSSIS